MTKVPVGGSHNQRNPKLITKILDNLPKESFGACLNFKGIGSRHGCKASAVVLGDGLCMKCWDRGTRTRSIKDIKDNASMWKGGANGRVALDNDSDVKRTQATKSHMKFI